MTRILLAILGAVALACGAQAAEWKNWGANPPPQGSWVMARHPSVPGTFNVDPATMRGDLSNVEWMDWTVPDPSPLLIVDVLGFKELFTDDEFVAIKASTDHHVQQFLDEVNTPSVAYVNLRDPIVTNGVAYLVGISLLTSDRAAAILAGTPPS